MFPTEVSSFDFQVECTGRTVQYKLNAQYLRLICLHRDVNDAHRAGAKRLRKQTKTISSVSTELSQKCVRNSVLVKQVGTDPYCQSNLTHRSRQQIC